jgi:hypothetical protein
MAEEWNIRKLKEAYLILLNKYNLPAYEKLNEDFQIEKAAEYETEFVLKEIREIITNKFLNYLRFIESILNPSNSPMFMFAVVKTLGAEEKEKLTELYKKIAKIEVDLIELDLEYSERKEAEAIKKYYEMWQNIKKDFMVIVEVIKKNWDNKIEEDKGNYLG